MKAHHSLAALVFVAMVGAALPARSAQSSRSTDASGTSAAVFTPDADQSPRGPSLRGASWKTLIKIGIGAGVRCLMGEAARKGLLSARYGVASH